MSYGTNWIAKVRWPTTVTAKPKTSRQNQRPHGKTNYFTAKTKAILFLLWSIWFCREVFCSVLEELRSLFGFAVRYFVFALRFLVLPWGILFLPWGFWFCRDSCGPPYLCNSVCTIRHKIKETLLSNNCCFSRPALQFPLMTYLNQFRALYS